MNAIQRAYDQGRYADGQALNRAAGIARGGTAESGGAMTSTTTTEAARNGERRSRPGAISARLAARFAAALAFRERSDRANG